MAVAVDHGIANRRERHSDELVVAGCIAADTVIPAAVLVAEIGRKFGQVDEFVGILMGVVEPAHHHVRTGADIGGNGSLRTDIFPAFLVDANVDAGRLGELLGVGKPGILVSLDEGRPAKKPEACAFFRLVARFGLGERRSDPNGERPAIPAAAADAARKSRLLIVIILLLEKRERILRRSPSRLANDGHRIGG
ncbi:hypothetical protein AJ87_45405 [Rhizobium yanglingense]|nr:hypothetical protein AJ87_45405 [Rhizobium yanglingense]